VEEFEEIDAPPALPVYTVTVAPDGEIFASGDKAAAVAEIAERAIAAVHAPRDSQVWRDLEGMSEQLAQARDALAGQARRVVELQAGNELLQQQAQDLAQAKYALQQNRRDSTDVRRAINVLIDDLATLRGQLQIEREARSKAETLAERHLQAARAHSEIVDELEAQRARREERIGELEASANDREERIDELQGELVDVRRLAERMRASGSDRGEALVELERERNGLRAALATLVAELCNPNTGEPVESHFTQADASAIVAAARAALEPAE
jgi:chromosome segregation ATPase